MTRPLPTMTNQAIYRWLMLCAVMIAMMVLLGGVTRLTESGLSIVEWRPITGTLPPLSSAAWQEQFGLYQASPQYTQVNQGMSLADFRQIFLMEWAHRFWGRLIFLAYLLPLIVFWARGRLSHRQQWVYSGLLLLVPLQGLMGWLMVKSGLWHEPRVSPLRLAAHLGLALLLFSLTLMQAWKLKGGAQDQADETPSGLRRASQLLLVLLGITIAAGALVAGNRAGWVYNEFPLMGGQFLPQEYGHFSPWWQNLIANHAAVQFNHRWLGVATTAAALALWMAFRRRLSPPLRQALGWVAALAVVQSALGIATLLHGVPIWLAALHQLNMVGLLAATLYLLHASVLRKPS